MKNSFGELVEIKKDALKSFEIKRKEKVIGTSTESVLTLYVKDSDVCSMLKGMGDELRRFFQVSKAVLSDTELADMDKYEHASIKVEKAAGKKCVRCWNYFDDLGQTDPAHPELCRRCTEAVKSLGV